MTQASPTVGQSASFRKTLSVADQGFFTGISGNLGALYVDRTRAVAQGFSTSLAFELVAGALFTTGLAQIGGAGHCIAQIGFVFARPVLLGETLAATVRVTGFTDEGDVLCALLGQVGTESVMTGEARLRPVNGG
ncbi:hypothetical protein [Phaeovulum sp. W22_SRMD_FR3]|uniref:hypothetical protein n=1 Tax=Phaeovulum sp. W22_SRMD_FR3 TaxID=3240274 RepID=UPI003F98C4B4